MNWDDLGFLLSKNRYIEKSLIAEIFTQEHGKISGIIFGGTSKKIKNYLQIGNHLHISFNCNSFQPKCFESQSKKNHLQTLVS